MPSRRAARLALPACLTLLVFGLSLVSVHWRPAGSDTAVWWPAAGVWTAWLLHTRRPHRWRVLAAVAAASAAANLVGGRPIALSLAFGALNALEPLTTLWWLSRQGPVRPRIDTVADAARFIVGSLLGALVIGVGAATTVVLLLDGSWPVSVRTVLVSHWAATLVIAPVLMVPQHRATVVARGLAEQAAQWTCAIAVPAAVFAPHQRLPLAFLVVPPLVWGAVRFSPRRVAWQLVAVGGLTALLTVRGDGPFADSGGRSPGVVVGLLQVFLVVLSTVMLVLALATDDRRRDAAEVSEREAMYRGGFADALLGMLLVRYDGAVLRVLHLNDVAARLLAAPADSLVGTAWCRCIAASDLPGFEAGVLRVLAGEAPGWHGEVQMDVGGRQRWMEVALAPSGRHLELDQPLLSVQMMDVTERRAGHEQMAHLALHDPLTALPNRMLLMDRIASAHARAARTGAGFSVHFLDLDGFKPINDAGGHARGDEVLREVAASLRAQVRESDTVARVGGDEFVVVTEGADVDLAAVRRRLREAVERQVVVGGSSHPLRVSIGSACSTPGSSAEALLQAADAAMYDDKRSRKAAGHLTTAG